MHPVVNLNYMVQNSDFAELSMFQFLFQVKKKIYIFRFHIEITRYLFAIEETVFELISCEYSYVFLY